MSTATVFGHRVRQPGTARQARWRHASPQFRHGPDRRLRPGDHRRSCHEHLDPLGRLDRHLRPAAPEYVYLAVLVGWVVGFMAGMGAFVGPIRWMLGRDLTHADAEYMAGKDLGWKRYWKFTTDHKVVGVQYFIMTMIILGFGGLLAMLIRTELGVTWAEVFSPEFLQLIIGTHGIAMIIGMIIVVMGPIANFIVPIMIGARDMAFPR
jgi:hypothetical protein